MRPALHAEWTKLRTVPSPHWLLLGMIAATVTLSAAAISVLTCTPAGCGGDLPKLSLMGVELGQAVVVVLAVIVVSGEYSSGMIRTTLTAVPRRTTAFAAKAITVSGVVAIAGTIAVLGSLVAGRFILPVHGDAALSDGATLRAAVGSILYLVLIALLSFGIAAVVRDAAASIGTVLALLYLVPILSQVIGDPQWQRLLQQVGPMSAGLTIQATTDLGDLPLSPWAGLGITAAWATAALAAGCLALGKRDA
ncbi:ABC transporter permease subunit [Kribbella deserti]|uniref:ABC transporter permease subunit n=1 Tax=Kribbella deserti TaxID=1926257 RepID=A0ABV6QGF4_9ACTN